MQKCTRHVPAHGYWAIKNSKSNIYIDDCLTGTRENGSFTELLKDHDRDVREVLECFRKHKLFVKGAKMHLFQREIKFCGHILSKGSRRAAPDKLKDIEAWVPERFRTVTQLKGFLGLTQYYAI